MPIILSRKGGGGGSGAPTGPAGGDLAGTYPNPTIGAGTVDRTELSTSVATQLTDGWVDDTAATWTRTANQTFTVTDDRTAVFSKGTRLKWTQTTVKYGVVVASSHAAGTTTVTIATTTDYVLTAAAISANYYSYAANPQGYPNTFAYTPTETGWAAGFTSGGSFSVIGGRCFCQFAVSGTSDTNAAAVSLPVTAGAVTVGTAGFFSACRIVNDGIVATAPGWVVLVTGDTSASIYRDANALAWTASGSKQVQANFVYEI